MITSLTFKNYRSFEDLNLSPLTRINLFGGMNNIGKTSVLEAVYLLFAREENQVARLPSAFRSTLAGYMNPSSPDDVATFWKSLFHDQRLERSVKISATTDSDKGLACTLTTSENPEMQAFLSKLDVLATPRTSSQAPSEPPVFGTINAPIASFAMGSGVMGRITGNTAAGGFAAIANRFEQPLSDADLYNRISLREGAEEKLIAALKLTEPRLTKLRYAKVPGTTQPLVCAHLGLRNALVMTQAGQGFNKLFSLFAHMILADVRVLLIDGIELGLCSEALPEIWKSIATLAALGNIQVFATTYSRECVLAAHDALKTLPNYDLTFHRMSWMKGRCEVVSHDADMLETAICSGLEMR